VQQHAYYSWWRHGCRLLIGDWWKAYDVNVSTKASSVNSHLQYLPPTASVPPLHQGNPLTIITTDDARLLWLSTVNKDVMAGALRNGHVHLFVSLRFFVCRQRVVVGQWLSDARVLLQAVTRDCSATNNRCPRCFFSRKKNSPVKLMPAAGAYSWHTSFNNVYLFANTITFNFYNR